MLVLLSFTVSWASERQAVHVNMDLNLLDISAGLDVIGGSMQPGILRISVGLTAYDTSHRPKPNVDFPTIVCIQVCDGTERYTEVSVPFLVDCLADVERRKQRVTIQSAQQEIKADIYEGVGPDSYGNQRTYGTEACQHPRLNRECDEHINHRIRASEWTSGSV